jgi:hypothetical protein
MAMRIGARLVVGLGLLCAVACNGPSPDEPECFSQKGLCLLTTKVAECATTIGDPGLCPTSYTCCIPKGAYDYDAGVDAGKAAVDSSAPPADAATKDVVTTTDAAKTSTDASKLDGAAKD